MDHTSPACSSTGSSSSSSDSDMHEGGKHNVSQTQSRSVGAADRVRQLSTDSDMQEGGGDNVSQVHSRGTGVVARIRQLTKEYTKKIRLEWDPYGKPWDDLSTLMESYIGYLTRTQVPITYRDWRKVPHEIKNSIKDTVEQAFEIPDNADKGYILRSAGEKLRDFRKVLNREARRSTDPPAQYDFIDQDTWDEFLRQRCTKDFQELSARNSENAKKSEYPYRLSRKGYRRKKRDMIIQRGEDPATSSIPRVDLWLAARQTVSGKLDPRAEKVAAKIALLKNQESQGLIKPAGRDDILALALGKDEHPGRVRCAGFGVSSKQYFGENKRTCLRATQQKVTELQNQVATILGRMEEMHKCMMEMQQGRNYQGQNHQGDQNHQSRHDSCSHKESQTSLERDKGEWKQCQLYWPDLTKMVALGQVLILQIGSYTVLHGQNLDSETLKVRVEMVATGQEKTIVPYMSGEVTYIEDAIGGFIAWPKDMVICLPDCSNSKGAKIFASKPIQSMNNCSKDAQPQQSGVMSRVSSMLSSIPDVNVHISMPKDILQHEHSLHFGKKELSIWIQGTELEAVHIAVYMKCLCENHNSNKYAFLCPSQLACPPSKDLRINERTQYMEESLINKDMRGRLWFAPYNGGHHWMLAVIEPLQSMIYWLDPLGYDVREDFKGIATRAMKRFNRQVVKVKRHIRWKVVKCPKQPNNIECGYYICRYMLEIIERGVDKIPNTYFEDSPEYYEKEHIDEVRKEWLDFMEPFIQDEINNS